MHGNGLSDHLAVSGLHRGQHAAATMTIQFEISSHFSLGRSLAWKPNDSVTVGAYKCLKASMHHARGQEQYNVFVSHQAKGGKGRSDAKRIGT